MRINGTPLPAPHEAQAAHCESGVTMRLLREAGLEVSEPLAFGVGSGIFFTHVPFVKVTGHPLTAFRNAPGSLFKKACVRLGATYEARTFLSKARAARVLDALVGQGVKVGLRTNIYWLTYFPKQFRFNFNGHHIVVEGKRGDTYAIHDPVVDTPMTCHEDLLERARFAPGILAPRGYLFHVTRTSAKPDWGGACLAGLEETSKRMLEIPIPIFGVKGIRLLARRLEGLPERRKDEEAIFDDLAFVVRMQEEIGTGGAGFRYLFGAFLEEAAFHTGLEALRVAASRVTEAGDRWREFAVLVSRICKGKEPLGAGLSNVRTILEDCAAREQAVFEDLRASCAEAKARGRLAARLRPA